MKRKNASKCFAVVMIATLLLISMLTLAFNIPLVIADPGVIRVPTDYPTIQKAINAAQNGDTIIVGPGTYNENIVVNKSVKLDASEVCKVTINGTKGKAGIVVDVDASNVEINGFHIRNGAIGIWVGVYLSNVIIQLNNIEEMGESGITADFVGNLKIEGNSVKNSPWGINKAQVEGGTVKNNRIEGSTKDGLSVSKSKDEEISGNTITNSSVGLNITDTSGELVYHNNFINNTIQVYSYNSTNTWHNGYPSGGNYWSDYNGTDMYSGPYQNETGSDGIWDYPYVIDENNQDKYPLVHPYNPLPEPWIVEPSILDSEVPVHNDTIVIWGDFINISAVELKYAEDIENTTFEYSPNGINWELIGISFEGIKEWENWTDIYGTPFDGFRKWSVAWNTSGVSEGLYHIRATMVDTVGQIGQNNITVYFDRTPPIPEFTLPWGVAVNGTIQISVETNATDVLYTQFESLKVSTEYKVPPVTEPDTACAWNSIAALLMYWATRPSKTDPKKKPLEYLIKDDKDKVMNPGQLINALVDKFNKVYMKNKPEKDWKTRKKGLTSQEIEFLLIAWLHNKGIQDPWNWMGGFRNQVPEWPRWSNKHFEHLKEEFEANKGPLIVGIKSTQPKLPAHAMVLKSMENKPVKEDKNNLENNEYRVDFMDSYSKNGLRWTTMKGYNDLYIYMDWDGNPNTDGVQAPNPEPPPEKIWVPDGYWYVSDKIQIIPDKKILEGLDLLANWIPEGIDHNGADGWSLALDTTQLEEGYHFIRATMVDSSGSNGTQTTEIFVDNIPPVPGDHDIAITNLTASRINITVTVENQGRYNETAYVSVYSEGIGTTARIDLASGANTILTFEWTPSPGEYNITAEVDPILDEVDIADNTLTTTISIGPIDIAVTNVTSFKTVVGQGYSVSINVTVTNQGNYSETFNVTAYANTTVIDTRTDITLTSGNPTTITFTWDTTGFAKGNYTISAYAWPVPGETDTTDNTYVDGTIQITAVQPYAPIAVFTEVPEIPYVYQPVYFDASTSKPGFDGDDGCPITEYHWDFGDGTSGTGKTIKHIYYKSGNYTVTLTVYAPGIPPYIDPQYVGTNTTDTIQHVKQVLPVGGYSIPIDTYTTATPPTTYFAILTIITAVFTAIRRKTHRKIR
jgi:nitrous oxidase accessory protein NosD